MQVFSSIASRGVRRHDRSRYATLTAMQRTAVAPFITRFPQGVSSAWLARRWYYTPKSRRAYSVRQISPGDRRLLAQFMVELNAVATERDQSSLRDLTALLFDRVIVGAGEGAVALETTPGGDRVIGVCAC